MPSLLSISSPALASDEERGLSTEWLETNGLGDFASSSLWMCPTRRYHAWLVVRPEDREKRYVLFSRFEEQVQQAEESWPLSSALYETGARPSGHQQLSHFALAPHPTSSYSRGALSLRRELQMPRGERAVLVRYTNTSSSSLTLRLRPQLPYREADALTIKNDALDTSVASIPAGLSFQPYAELPELYLTLSSAFAFEADPRWEQGLSLPADQARGYPHQEDHFSPGELSVTLAAGAEVVIGISIDAPLLDPAEAWSRATRARAARVEETQQRCSTTSHLRLDLGADDFFTHVDGRAGIDAGFPWFGEWGRDTFIALPGLTLARGDLATCEEVLGQSLSFLKDGLLPNIFGLTQATSHYGSVDAALWYARAVQLYAAAGGSEELILEEYLPALLQIASNYWNGTGLGIEVDEGGLIQAGSAELNATWMDAMTPSGPVTPRAGCAVEINALWYSLLRHVELLTKQSGPHKLHRLWRKRRKLAGEHFLSRFWLGEAGHLADLWTPEQVDPRVRPNMVLAAALELSPLSVAQRASVAACSERELVTDCGLRTLAPGEADYQPRFQGGPEERDNAYHQGTVWPWLFGFHVEAALRGGRPGAAQALSKRWDSICSEIDRAGLNHISEVFDGEAPRRPGGTIAQAWNTAELLRAKRLLEGGLNA